MQDWQLAPLLNDMLSCRHVSRSRCSQLQGQPRAAHSSQAKARVRSIRMQILTHMCTHVHAYMRACTCTLLVPTASCYLCMSALADAELMQSTLTAGECASMHRRMHTHEYLHKHGYLHAHTHTYTNNTHTHESKQKHPYVHARTFVRTCACADTQTRS